MRTIRYIIFDFDGTIADSIDLALNIYNKIAHEYNCKSVSVEDRKTLDLRKSKELLKEYGITGVKLVMLLLRIRKELGKCIAELKPIKDIKTSLLEIEKSGLKLGVLTSNSKRNAGMFFKNNGLAGKFEFIYSGKSLFGKDKVMMQLFEREKIAKEEVIYVGDEIRDIEASRKAGIKVIAVCWGLTNKAELETYQPDQIAETPAELFPCIQEIIHSV